jgi:hypothetical protein
VIVLVPLSVFGLVVVPVSIPLSFFAPLLTLPPVPTSVIRRSGFPAAASLILDGKFESGESMRITWSGRKASQPHIQAVKMARDKHDIKCFLDIETSHFRKRRASLHLIPGYM